MAHQSLLELARVMSTKVYLSSKGVDETARQHATTWRQRFLQSGIQGTSTVFRSGRTHEALAGFPPTASELQQSFVAVCTGPEDPTEEQRTDIDGTGPEHEQAREAMARARLRKEVELEVDKGELDSQARYLLRTNYVYQADGRYRADFVDAMPDERMVPPCFGACAVFVPVDPADADVPQASGPATTTTAGEQETLAAEEADAAELVKWLSIADEDNADVAEMTAMPSMQRLLERMESQAGRVVANELLAMTSESGYGAEDELGRSRLASLSREFHALCEKFSPEEEAQELL